MGAAQKSRMKVHFAALSVVRSQRARERMIRKGRTPNGHWLWTPREDAVVRLLYPDYVALRRSLRRRTYNGLRYRTRTLGIAKKRHVWLTTEEARLRRLYPKVDRSELLLAFPGMTWQQIVSKARRIGVWRMRRKLNPTGHPLIDMIRDRAFDLRLSMVDLDAMAGTKRYFQTASWRKGRPNRKALLQAVDALGGEVSIRWQ